MGEKRSSKLMTYGVAALVIVILAAIFLIGPAITGFSTYQKVKGSGLSMDDFASDLGKLRDQVTEKAASLQKCDEFSNELFTRMDNFDQQISECNAELQSKITELTQEKERSITLQSEITDSYEDQLRALREDNEDLTEERNDIQEEYDAVVADAGRRICCTQKVLENADIKYYDVEDNKIVCKTSEGNEISC